MIDESCLRIGVGHSPDADDAFMFYALAQGKVPTGRYRFEHELVDIETLNRRAFSGVLELTALSVHAYAHLADRYVLCTCGASMGEQYGPMVVARRDSPLAGHHAEHGRERVRVRAIADSTIAVPGRLTTAFLALRLCLGQDFAHVLVPFDRILDAVQAGSYEGQPVDAGLVIHEGQLTYARQNLELLVDLGQWWHGATGLPLPLGVNAIRRDLGPQVMADVERLLLASIEYGLSHREEALAYALGFGRGLDRADADRFVGMYVNRWTLDLGPVGRQAVAELLARGHAAGALPRLVVPEFVENSPLSPR
jgi:1,4-dihydroxy-6-naphthoate synthase